MASYRLDENLWFSHGIPHPEEEIRIEELFRLFVANRIADAAVDCCSPLYLVRSRRPPSQQTGTQQRRQQLDDGQSPQRGHRAPQQHLVQYRSALDFLPRLAHLQLEEPLALAAPHREEFEIQIVVLSQVPGKRFHRLWLSLAGIISRIIIFTINILLNSELITGFRDAFIHFRPLALLGFGRHEIAGRRPGQFLPDVHHQCVPALLRHGQSHHARLQGPQQANCQFNRSRENSAHLSVRQDPESPVGEVAEEPHFSLRTGRHGQQMFRIGYARHHHQRFR